MVFPSSLKIYATSGTIWHFIWYFLLFYCSIQAPVSLGFRSSLILNHTKSIRHLSLYSSQDSKKGIHRKYLRRLEAGFVISFGHDLWTTIIIINKSQLIHIEEKDLFTVKQHFVWLFLDNFTILTILQDLTFFFLLWSISLSYSDVRSNLFQWVPNNVLSRNH